MSAEGIKSLTWPFAARPTLSVGYGISTKRRRWDIPTPAHAYQKLPQKTLMFRTYGYPGIDEDAVFVTPNGSFAIPDLPCRWAVSHDQVPGSNLCEACENIEIRKLFGRGHGRRYLLGTSKGILGCTSCPLCRLIAASLQQEFQDGYTVNFQEYEAPENVGKDLLQLENSCYVMLTSLPSSHPALFDKNRQHHILCWFIHHGTGSIVGQSIIRLLDEDVLQFNKSGMFCGRLMDSNKADMKLARSWLIECDHHHSCMFQDDQKASRITNLLVIDVRKSCMVQLPVGAIYMALSYTWPLLHLWPYFKPLQLLKTNLEDAKVPGYFTRMQSGIPNVIKNAFQAVRDLDETYLWVDALCIVQDDEKVQADLISKMGEVYGGAYLTLVVATDSDPVKDYSIPGVGVPRRKQQLVETLEGLRLISALPDYNQSLSKSKWLSRGWTYQEGLLSRRCLIFTDDQMYFRCCQDARCEDVTSGPDTIHCYGHSAKPNQRESKIDYLLNSEFLPDLKRNEWFREYVRVVCEYSKRSFKYEDDILNAFQGIMNKLMPYINHSGFFCGHPFKRFKKSLLWYPVTPSYRRTAFVNKETHEHLFPSWSWTGWVGAVDYEVDRPGSVPELHKVMEILGQDLDMVEWFRWDLGYGLVPVGDNFHNYQHEGPLGPRGFEIGLLAAHSSILAANRSRIVSWASTIKRRLQLPEKYITQWLTTSDQTLPCLAIQDTQGRACGLLPSADRTWMQDYIDAGAGDCELLMLSVTERGSDDLRSGEALLHTDYRMRSKKPIRFFDVMLIEYVDEIAYRRGIGLVHGESVDFLDIYSAERKVVVLG